MAMGSGPSRGVKSDINVTPLVDVVLVLLIIFMVIAPALEHGERVELPSIMEPDQVQKGKLDPVTVTVGRGGSVYLEKAPTTLAASASACERMPTSTPSATSITSCRDHVGLSSMRTTTRAKVVKAR